jgi:hypothetical protein
VTPSTYRHDTTQTQRHQQRRRLTITTSIPSLATVAMTITTT